MDDLVVQALSGLASASSLFLVASGLTVIFGVTRVVNFAHGSLYMLGAYVAWSLVTHGVFAFAGPFWQFWGGILGAAVVTAAIGAVIEVLLLRRIYRAPELFQLLATFGVVLVVQDVALWAWGAQDLLGPRAPMLRGAVRILGLRFPLYELFLIAVGPLVLAGLWLLFHRTRFGVLVRAATADREMVAALGVNQALLFTGVFALGAGLAGLGGALQLPRESVNLHMDLSTITEAFVVVVVGGLGSLTGAFLAALLIGELSAFGILILPKITLVLVFLVMAVVLVVRPYGLLGRAPQGLHASSGPPDPLLLPAPRALRQLGAVVLALLVGSAWVLPDYELSVLTEILVALLFAASLHFIMGPGGLASFGHAAYFGAGAYAAALLVQHAAAPMWAGMLLAPFAAGLLGLVFGWFCVRLSGVYAAMLTLAFAQIAWSTAFQWVEVTGGDNGILGVWPDAWAQPKPVFYLLALVLCVGGAMLLRRIVWAPFGAALRAGRDSPLRAEAIGIDTFRTRWMAFAISAAFAGVAGSVFAYAKGSVFPTYLGISRSVDALLMVLLGGVQTLSGPLLGAVALTGLQEQLMRGTDHWRLLLGATIILLVVFFPQGLAGAARAAWEKRA
ncbi:amino acid/amide ABC transporter membrane protein 1 (HAAT family) /amino acid/amide ABC transporter membrane protein 2 (HAAT family) [Humitalea rosea]|uniref:Amino acid/amide ABC transporter membrane protein 1 (HAAT family) /amino acid/amide ABC transporter membrane protein 2 (HAAT family) n=1 Tax=Humitalea rosea TaxID=990373 RepID=A0A2W7JBC9_9PROT|nr:ABC transporter permease [Humitalea rosea]PZW48981.1 amino acid/amide ABC transporter membrane protein 1 (HAAT family) /amino acid/amide ABC transporter membrane protein 2 (HAAT family) [Humitalea rosea]